MTVRQFLREQGRGMFIAWTGSLMFAIIDGTYTQWFFTCLIFTIICVGIYEDETGGEESNDGESSESTDDSETFGIGRIGEYE